MMSYVLYIIAHNAILNATTKPIVSIFIYISSNSSIFLCAYFANLTNANDSKMIDATPNQKLYLRHLVFTITFT